MFSLYQLQISVEKEKGGTYMVSIKNKLASLCLGIALSLGTISGITAFSTMNKSNKALAIGETYQRLESVSDINSSASYVLGVEGTGFHTSGTSSWGITKLPTQSPPFYILLK